MDVSAIRAVANAILYEGYMLYPYRPSALKNRSQGWTFGTLLPEQYAEHNPGETAQFTAEVLVTGRDAQLSVEFRFLHLREGDALERSVIMESGDLRAAPHGELRFEFGGKEDASPIFGRVRLECEQLGEAIKIRIAIINESAPEADWETRDSALRQALVSAHALLTVSGGEFVSLLNPPDELRDAAATCEQKGVFPVLAGTAGERTAMLVSPIILYDDPQIAPKSHGDFFDSSEIDEMLTLRVLTLTDAEKEEVRAANERARALLERTESLTAEDILNLHSDLSGMTRAEKA